jgi:hypothetical protein
MEDLLSWLLLPLFSSVPPTGQYFTIHIGFSTSPTYIRCIKINPQATKHHFTVWFSSLFVVMQPSLCCFKISKLVFKRTWTSSCFYCCCSLCFVWILIQLLFQQFESSNKNEGKFSCCSDRKEMFQLCSVWLCIQLKLPITIRRLDVV